VESQLRLNKKAAAGRSACEVTQASTHRSRQYGNLKTLKHQAHAITKFSGLSHDILKYVNKEARIMDQ